MSLPQTEKTSERSQLDLILNVAAGKSIEPPLLVSLGQVAESAEAVSRPGAEKFVTEIQDAVENYVAEYFKLRPIAARVPVVQKLTSHEIIFNALRSDQDGDLVMELELRGLSSEKAYLDLRKESGEEGQI